MSDPREQRKYPGDQNEIAGHLGDGILSDGFEELFGHVLGELTLEGARIAATDHAPGDCDKSAGISGLGPEAQFGEGPHHGRFIEGRQGEHQFEETETEETETEETEKASEVESTEESDNEETTPEKPVDNDETGDEDK